MWQGTLHPHVLLVPPSELWQCPSTGSHYPGEAQCHEAVATTARWCVCKHCCCPCHVLAVCVLLAPAEAAAKDGLGKGFKPEVAPLNSILGKLAARQAALEAK